jgi:hypothetical protein
LWALIAEIVGGAAVVISVIYLAIQINDNTRMLRSQSHYNIIDVLHEPAAIVLESPDLASLLNRCDSQPSRVSVQEWERCSWFYFLQLDGFEYAYYQTLDQAIPNQIWEGVYGAIRQDITQKKGFARFWKEREEAFAEPFRSCINALVKLNPYLENSKQDHPEGEVDFCTQIERS